MQRRKLFRHRLWRYGDMTIAIENVILLATFPHGLELDAVAAALPTAKWQSGKFPGLVYEFARPAVTLLMFSSGKIICTGAKSRDEAERAIRKLVEMLRTGGVAVEEPEISVENIVVSSELGFSLNLERLAASMGLVYEPERFPGAVYKSKGKTVLIFPSGRIVCMGSKSEKEAREIVEELRASLSSCRETA